MYVSEARFSFVHTTTTFSKSVQDACGEWLETDQFQVPKRFTGGIPLDWQPLYKQLGVRNAELGVRTWANTLEETSVVHRKITL